jgi:hypothetical protein
MPQGNASFCQAMQSGTAAGAAFPADLAKPLHLSALHSSCHGSTMASMPLPFRTVLTDKGVSNGCRPERQVAAWSHDQVMA